MSYEKTEKFPQALELSEDEKRLDKFLETQGFSEEERNLGLAVFRALEEGSHNVPHEHDEKVFWDRRIKILYSVSDWCRKEQGGK